MQSLHDLKKKIEDGGSRFENLRGLCNFSNIAAAKFIDYWDPHITW